jgi:RHS repeat-associated protein
MTGALPASAQVITSADLQIQGAAFRIVNATAAVQLGSPAIIQTSIGGLQNDQAPSFASGIVASGELIGPGIVTPVPFTIAPGHAFTITGLSQEGTYYLRNVRMMNGTQLLQTASPSLATITVTNALNATVTVRQLSADELRKRGITLDATNYDVYEYTFSFLINGQTVQIPYPVIVNRITHETTPLPAESPYQLPLDQAKAPPRWNPPSTIPVDFPEPADFSPTPQTPDNPDAAPPRRAQIHAAIVIPNSLAVLHEFKAGAADPSDTNGGLLKQIIHGGLSYDDPIEVTMPSQRLYPVYDEAGDGNLQAVIDAGGKLVARNVPSDPYGADALDVSGAAVDRVEVHAKKDNSGNLQSVDVTVHSTEAIAATTVAAGLRLSAVNASGTAVSTSTVVPQLAEGYSARFTLTPAQWTTLITAAGAESLSVAVTTTLRAQAWSSAVPFLPPPDWAKATSSVYSNPYAVEVRDSLSTLATFVSNISPGAENTRTLYKLDTLALAAPPAGGPDPISDLLATRFQAQPFAEPFTHKFYVRERWLDPVTGTWLSPDPMGYRDSSNLYGYAGGDPVNGRDPSGTRAATEAEKKKIEELKAAGKKLHDDWVKNGKATFTTYRWGVAPGVWAARSIHESWIPTAYGITTQEQYENARRAMVEDIQKYQNEIAAADAGEAVTYIPWIQAQLNFGQNVLGAGTVVQSAINAVGAAVAPTQAKNEPIPEIAAGWSTGRSPAVSDIAQLRSRTPDQATRDVVNPPGPKTDPIYGYPVARYQADHVVPFAEILQMPGFLELKFEDQIAVLNHPTNQMGLGGRTNASKRDTPWSEWRGHSQLGPVDPATRAAMISRAANIKRELQREIDSRR